MDETWWKRWRAIGNSTQSFEDISRKWTFQEIARWASRFRHRLEATRPLRGRSVLLQGAPSASWSAAFFAILEGGGIVVPVPLGAPASELAYFAEDSGATLAVVASDGRGDRPDEAWPDAVERIRITSIESATECEPDPGPVDRATDCALMLYTSGTTGKPKGARLTYGNLTTQTEILAAAWGITESDVTVLALPMHHLHGIVVAFLTSTFAGAGIRALAKFDAGRVFDLCEGATVLMAVPTMYAKLTDTFETADDATRRRWTRALSSLRLLTSGSATLSPTLADRVRAISQVIPLERYGMTEIGIALSNPLEPAQRRRGFVGAALPSVEIRIVDDHGNDGDGPGELWVRGPSVFAGYHRRPEETTKTFREGWFLTGDVAERVDGAIRLLGRTSVDILKTGGEKVSALEIEALLAEHPAVAEVAVCGIADPIWGERVVAAVVPRCAAADADPEELRTFLKTRLSAHKVPKEIRLVEALPRNAMGKVQKKELVLAWEQSSPPRE